MLVSGATGSGKSTQIPQFVLEAGLHTVASGSEAHAGIIVSQPRRLPAAELAVRVARELDVELGCEVGFQVGGESRISPQTRLKFITEGVLLRQLLGDPGLMGTGTVILD